MVNSGSPSKGCFLCRARKIKCDEGRPFCKRCEKSKRECPGYRDSLEINFHYRSTWNPTAYGVQSRRTLPGRNGQSSVPNIDARALVSGITNNAITCAENVPWRARRQSNPSKTTSPQAISHNRSQSEILPGLTISIDQQATCYFLANYVLMPSSGCHRGYNAFLPPLLRDTAPGSALSFAFSAVSLVSFENRPESKGLAPRSQKYYLSALEKVNVALRDPTTATEDSVLASVLLLGFYENLTFSREMVAGGHSHMIGAVTLLKLRGEKELHTSVGVQMYISVYVLMTIVAINKGIMPELSYQWLSPQIGSEDDADGWVAALNHKVAKLRTSTDELFSRAIRTPDYIEQVIQSLRLSEELEREYCRWEASLSSEWDVYSIAFVNEGPNMNFATSPVYPGPIYKYETLGVALVHNMVRTVRLMASTITLRCIAWLHTPFDYRLTPEYTTASKLSRKLLNDIISSVPYHLGYGETITTTSSSFNNFACGSNQLQNPQGLAAMSCIWPMFVALCSDFATDSQRVWLAGRLQYITDFVGIYQASEFKARRIRLPSMLIMKDSMMFPPPTVPVCSLPTVKRFESVDTVLEVDSV